MGLTVDVVAEWANWCVSCPKGHEFATLVNPLFYYVITLLLSPSSIIWYQLRLGVKVLTSDYGDVEFGNGPPMVNFINFGMGKIFVNRHP